MAQSSNNRYRKDNNYLNQESSNGFLMNTLFGHRPRRVVKSTLVSTHQRKDFLNHIILHHRIIFLAS